MKKPSLFSRFTAFFAIALSMCLVVNAETIIVYAPVVLVDGGKSGFYNSSLGTILDGTAPQFPLPFGSGGGDPLINPSDEPNLSAAANILGNWLTPHALLNPTNWLQAPTIPPTWADNTETAIIYEINGGTHGITNLFGNFDADNGLFVWVNGQYKFGARGPGLPSPAGQFEYTNVFLGNLLPGNNRIQILREDSGISDGFQIQIIGSPLGGDVLTCAPMPSGLVSWWRGEGNASDSAGTNTGILVGGTAFGLGGVGQEFKFDGVDDSVRIPVSGPLTPIDVGIGGGFTIEGWVNPTRLTIGPIAEWNDGAGGLGAHFWHSIDTIVTGDGPGNLYGNIVDTAGVSHSIVSPSGLVSTNTFNHVALTYDKTTGIAVIYHNRVAVKTQNLGIFTPQTSYDLHFGRRASGPFSDSFFKGSMDEMSLYNRALSAAEIESIALATYNGKCAVTNPPPQVVAVPVITSFNPTVATVGSSVTVSGTNFSPVASNNIVYFGAVGAGVSAASSSSLTVTVPAGATHAPITVTVGKLTAEAPAAFLPSFIGSGSNITASSFAPGQNLTVADGPFKTIIADIDGDGRPDLVEDNAYAHNISLFRNISVTGTLDGSSFAPRVDFPTLGGTDSPRCMAVADVDGDGKLDVLVGDQATSSVLVYRNIATPGTLTTGSLAAPVSFAAGSYPHGLRVADLNGDGLPEILVANHSGNSISILQNLGTAGSLTTNSFAPQYALVTGPNPTDVAIADFNSDGKPDLVTTAFGGSQLSVFRNVFTPGTAVSNWFTLDTTLPALSGSLEFAVADMDGDAKSDLVVASVHGYAVSVYRNQAGAGAFSPSSFAPRVDFGTPGWVHNVVVGDFNGDTKPDLAVTGELNSYMAVFQNQSTPGSFTTGSLAARVDYATGWNAWGVAAGDLDGDNRADIVFANSYDDTLTFYRNIIPFGEPTNPTNSCLNPPSSLFAWWRAETNTYNSIGGGAGSFASPNYNEGKVGTAFDFNGANNVVITDQPSFNPTNALTIECWVYPRALTVSYAQDLVSKDGEFSGPRQYMLTMGPQPGLDNGTGGFRAHVGVPGGFFYFIDGATKAQLNTWYHVAMTYDGATLKLFVNGNLDAQLAVTGPIITSSEPIRLGGGAPGNDPAYFFNGRLDEVALYGRALSQSEIQAIYNSGSAGKCPLPPPPAIVQHPQDQTINANALAQFAVTATGSPTLRYQWFFAGNPLLGATNSSLSIPNVLPVNAGSYFVTVSNDFGYAISSNATLTVLTFPPVITRQPTNVTVIETTAANFSVQATGSFGLTYQWLFNGQPLAGKIYTTFTLPSVQFSNAGNYSVIVTNPYGAVTSSVAVLTVNPRPPCAPVHDGLVSWWRGENDATDAWDSNGTVSRNLQYAAGKVGVAFYFPTVFIPDAPSLRATNAITLEAWVNPSSVSSSVSHIIISKFENPFGIPFNNQSAYLLGMTNNGLLFFTVSASGSPLTNTTTLKTGQTIPTNKWSHIAATYDGAALRLYINGVQVAQTNYSGGIFSGAASFGIGGIPYTPATTQLTWRYSGLMDEVALYNRALSAAEIQSIVAADLTGKCFAPPVITQQPLNQVVPLGEDVRFTVGVSGSRPLTYQWYFNGFGPQYRIIGATNASLLIEKVRTNNVGVYFVAVTNSVGSTASVRVQLSTLPAPSCTEILPGLISWWPGDTNTLDAMGLNNIAQYSPVSYPTGKVASSFNFNGTSSRIVVNSSASLNFTNNQNFSIEMWIKATNTPPSQTGGQIYPNVPLLEKRDSFTTGWLGYSLSLNNGKLAFALGAMKSPAGGTTNQMFISSSPDLRDGMFHHVAVTLNRTVTNGGVLYVDGSSVLVFDPRSHTNSLVNQQSLFIGAPMTTFSNSYFNGLIDEPAIYNRALTAAEILSIRTAGAAGRCKAKPIIVTQPANTNGVAGQNIALSVQATGTPLLRYQWRRTNQSLAGATNATYNITNLSAANIGTYSVIISNAFGTVTSSNAVVALANIPPFAYPGVASGFEDSQIQIFMQGSDPDNKNPNQGLSYFIISGPTNGILTGSTNSFMRTYIPNPNFFGTDSFTFVANDGLANSTNATFTITVRPVNDAPTAQSQLVATDEDTPIAITLLASDVDGDALIYQVTPPSRGTLSGVAPNLIYTPETNYFGEDLFTFTVTDASNVVSQIAAVGITVRPINDAPVAKIVIAPLDELPGVTNTVLIAPACCDATLLLDGSQSTDVENDALTYVWLDGTNVIATTATTTNRFRPGTHNITLIVSDGITADMETMIVEIITPSEAVDFLKSLVEDSITERRLRSPLVAWLRGAEESFERCHVELGVRFLEMFQQRVRDRLAPNDAELAQQLVDTAQAIIDAAPDCDPCHRLGRKAKRGHRDHDDHGRDRDEGRNSSEVRGGKSSPR